MKVCESLGKLTSTKTEWTWDATYQKMFDKAKAIVKEDASLKLYEENKPLYVDRDVPQVGLGAALLQQEAIQAVIEVNCWTIASLGQLHSSARA